MLVLKIQFSQNIDGSRHKDSHFTMILEPIQLFKKKKNILEIFIIYQNYTCIGLRPPEKGLG